MKKIVCIITALLASVSLVSCSGAEASAAKAFENMMNAFKSCDKVQIDEYYSFDDLTAYIEAEEGEALSEAVLKTLSKIEYNVKSTEKINSNAVKLEAEITTVDFSQIMSDYIEKVTEMIESPEYQARLSVMSDDEYQALMAQIMSKCIEDTGDSTETKTVEVTMIKETSGWKIGGRTDEFLGALFEDLSDAVEALV